MARNKLNFKIWAALWGSFALLLVPSSFAQSPDEATATASTVPAPGVDTAGSAQAPAAGAAAFPDSNTSTMPAEPVTASPIVDSSAVAPASVDNNALDAQLRKKQREGSIVNATVQQILEKRQELNPEYGFEDLFLTKGSSAVLDVQNLGLDPNRLVPRVTAGNIIESDSADPSGGRRIKAGQQIGSTQVLIYSPRMVPGSDVPETGKLLKVYRITVTNDDLVALLQEMRALIGDVEGIELKIVGQQVVVDGQVLVPKDMRRVLTVVNKYVTEKKPILNLIEISPLTLKLLGEKMEEEIAGGKDRPRDIRVKVVNGRFFLEGNVDKVVDRQTAEKICQSYVSERYTLKADLEKPSFPGLGECVTMVRIRAGQAKDPDPIVSVRVDFVTLNKNYLKNFNFSWAPGVGADGTIQYRSDTGQFLTQILGTVSSLFPKLRTAAQHGYARILKSATVLVRDGDDETDGKPAKATISERVAIPFVISQGANNPPVVSYTNVDTSITVRARSIAGSDKLNVGIVAVQTEVQAAANDKTPPSTLANQVETQIVVPNGESAALGGLSTERRTVAFDRNPASSDPSQANTDFNIFNIGRAYNFSDSKGQFIVFVTPEKLRTTTEGTDKLKRKFRLRK